MNAASYEPGRNALMLGELRLPTIGRLWSEFAQRSDKEGWPAGRFLGALLEHEVAERASRRLQRHRDESQLDAAKTLASFEFAEVPMLSKAHVMALASGNAWIDKGATCLIFGPPGVGKSHLGWRMGFSNALFPFQNTPVTPPAELSDTHPSGCWARHQPVEH